MCTPAKSLEGKTVPGAPQRPPIRSRFDPDSWDAWKARQGRFQNFMEDAGEEDNSGELLGEDGLPLRMPRLVRQGCTWDFDSSDEE
jgi:hypothetical protein